MLVFSFVVILVHVLHLQQISVSEVIVQTICDHLHSSIDAVWDLNIMNTSWSQGSQCPSVDRWVNVCASVVPPY